MHAKVIKGDSYEPRFQSMRKASGTLAQISPQCFLLRPEQGMSTQVSPHLCLLHPNSGLLTQSSPHLLLQPHLRNPQQQHL